MSITGIEFLNALLIVSEFGEISSFCKIKGTHKDNKDE
jgi:hypothetical protein